MRTTHCQAARCVQEFRFFEHTMNFIVFGPCNLFKLYGEFLEDMRCKAVASSVGEFLAKNFRVLNGGLIQTN